VGEEVKAEIKKARILADQIALEVRYGLNLKMVILSLSEADRVSLKRFVSACQNSRGV